MLVHCISQPALQPEAPSISVNRLCILTCRAPTSPRRSAWVRASSLHLGGRSLAAGVLAAYLRCTQLPLTAMGARQWRRWCGTSGVFLLLHICWR
jgi:hypothetical protein